MRHPLHDYTTPGAYFITFVTLDRQNLLGTIRDGKFQSSKRGKIVERTWFDLPRYFPNLQLDAFQLMPDHVHCIMILVDPKLSGVLPGKAKGIPQVVQAFKGMSARKINRVFGTPGQAVWQRGYNDRVIRSERELEKFRQYTLTNPLRQVFRPADGASASTQ